MTWKEVRNQFPKQWLLVEAVKARTEADKRIVDEFSVIRSFTDSGEAMRSYGELHREQPQRELLVLHTDRETLDITVRYWAGVRAA